MATQSAPEHSSIDDEITSLKRRGMQSTYEPCIPEILRHLSNTNTL